MTNIIAAVMGIITGGLIAVVAFMVGYKSGKGEDGNDN